MNVIYHLRSSLILFLLLVNFSGALAQEFPVQVTPVLPPPYSLYLSDYASPESNFQLIIQLRELDRPEYKVKLRMTIEGQGITIRTRPSYIPQAIVLQGGVTEMLSGVDIKNYFNPDNLDFVGISKQEFMNKGALPEGFYTFKFEVIDYVRNVVVSNAGFANAWIILNDPPIINLPFNAEKVLATDPQNVTFSWTPRHTASPNAAFTTEYEFTMVELYPDNRNPNDAMRVAKPIFVTETSSTSLNYGITETLLIPGRKYAFRIKAYDTEGRDLFKNNGYSEVFVFQFGDACIPPSGIKSEALDEARIKLTWDAADLHTGYAIQYRKQGSTTWNDQDVFTNSVIIPGLKAKTIYEYQIKGSCGTIQGDYSAVASVTTLEANPNEFVCGTPPPGIEIKTTPLPNKLQIDDLIQTADFEISVTEVEENPDGSYKGKGKAFLPWFNFATVQVKFRDIRVNEDYRVYSGDVTTVYTKSSKFIANMDLADEEKQEEGERAEGAGDDDFVAPDTVTLPVDVQEIIVNLGTNPDVIVVVAADGTTQEIPREKSEDGKSYEDTVIKDNNGDTWIVGKDGKVSEGPSTGAPDALTSLDGVDYIVKFAPVPEQEYGFDAKDSPLGSYEKATIRDKDYDVSWKSVETGRQDRVAATADGESSFPGAVGFKVNGAEAPSQASSNAAQKTVFITGKAAGTEESLSAYVTVKESDDDEAQQVELGKLNIKTYDKIRKKVVIVPVNQESSIDAASLQTELNNIYKSAVVEWDVEIAPKFEYEPNDLVGLDAEESDIFSSFPEKMQIFNRTFANTTWADAGSYYLFLIKGSGSKRTGFMPFKRKYGYIFNDKGGDLITTIAHELGHGAFRLRHTFSPEAFLATEKTTNNLMDYKGGHELKKYQWDFVHDPENMNGWLEDDDESSSAIVVNLEGLRDFANKDSKGVITSYTFLSRSGKPISLPSTITSIVFSTGDEIICKTDGTDPFRISPFGTLTSFKTKDEKGVEKYYKAYWDCNQDHFAYYKAGDNDIYYDTYTDVNISKAIVGFPGKSESSAAIIFKVGQVPITPISKQEKYTAAGSYEVHNFLLDEIKAISKFNEVNAIFDPDYDVEVRQFIIDNLGQGFDGSKFYDNDIYVFIHATQLQKYSILKGCFRTGVPGELLKFITAHTIVTTSGPGGPLGGVTSSSVELPIFGKGHENGSKVPDAKSLIHHWAKYDLNYYPVIAKAVSEFIVPAKPSAKEVYDLLRPISDNVYTDNLNCYWEKIGVSQRKDFIEKLMTQNTAGDVTEEAILMLISTVHGPENQAELLRILETDNYAFLKKVWDILDAKERLQLSLQLTRWLSALKPVAADYATKEYNTFETQSLPNPENVSGNITVKDNVFYLFNTNWVEDGLLNNFEANFTDDRNIVIKHEYSELIDPILGIAPLHFTHTCKPFDWIVLKVVDDFQDFGLAKDELIAVPAIFIYGLDSHRDRDQNLAALRVAGDLLAIALAPVTAGGSTAILLIEVTAATIDIVVTTNRSELESYLGQEATVFWDVLYGGWNLFTLGKTFFIPKTVVVNGVSKISGFQVALQNADEIANAVAKHGNAAEKLSYLATIENLLNVLKTSRFQNSAEAFELFSRVLEFKLKVQRSLKLEEVIVDISIKNGNLLVNNSMSLAKIDFANKLPTLTQNIRWIPQITKQVRLVDQFDNIASVNGTSTQIAKIDVVEDLANTGQYYLRLTNLANAVSSLPASIRNFVRDFETAGGKLALNGSNILLNSPAGVELATITAGKLKINDGAWVDAPKSSDQLTMINRSADEFRIVSSNDDIFTGDIQLVKSSDGALGFHYSNKNGIPFINGYTAAKLKRLLKSARPENPSDYLPSNYLSDHADIFAKEGGAFIAVRSSLATGDYAEFPLRKYVMLTSDMMSAVQNYRTTRNIDALEDALGYERGSLKGFENEIYIFRVDNSKYRFEMPNGKELGANKHWEPGGQTAGGKREAVIIDRVNPDQKIIHNKNIENLRQMFLNEKLIE